MLTDGLRQIAHIESPYKSKFGVPRQAGLADTPARVVFEPDYRSPEAVRGLEAFGYVWLLWLFHANRHESWSPTVRPPRLGGNKRVGVFASRSPFRPNPIGLSAVRLQHVAFEGTLGPVLYVQGADMVDGTPVVDVKPYVPYADCHADAAAGFAPTPPARLSRVVMPEHLADRLPETLRKPLEETLLQDPRPSYQHSPERVYALSFGPCNVRFRVDDNTAVVVDIEVFS